MASDSPNAGDVGKETNRADEHSFPHGWNASASSRQRRRGLESAFGRSSQRRVSAHLLAAHAGRSAIQGINFALH